MYGCTGANHPMYGRTGANHPMYGKEAANAMTINVYSLDGKLINSFFFGVFSFFAEMQGNAAKWLNIPYNFLSPKKVS
jgi:NUMOD3 motif